MEGVVGMARLKVLKMNGCCRPANDALLAALASSTGPGPVLEILDVGHSNIFTWRADNEEDNHNNDGDGGETGSAAARAESVTQARRRSCFETVTDAGLAALSTRCVSLRELNLAGFNTFSCVGLCTLLRALRPQAGHNGGSLQILELRGCVQGVDDTVLTELPQSCPKLEQLGLAYCASVGDEGVRSMADGCPKLERLDLYGCSNIEDVKTLDYVARQCPSLKHLRIGRCKISQAEITEFARRAPQGLAVKSW